MKITDNSEKKRVAWKLHEFVFFVVWKLKEPDSEGGGLFFQTTKKTTECGFLQATRFFAELSGSFSCRSGIRWNISRKNSFLHNLINKIFESGVPWSFLKQNVIKLPLNEVFIFYCVHWDTKYLLYSCRWCVQINLQNVTCLVFGMKNSFSTQSVTI